MIDYPYSTPQIMSDVHFLAFGGESGTSSIMQRQAAYFIAEAQMTEHIHTLLVPTIVTGTYYNPSLSMVVTDYGHVNQLVHTSISSANLVDCVVSFASGCGVIRQDRFGYVDIGYALGRCGCSSGVPYSVQLVYEAGLPSGVALRPDMLLALTMAAQINLNEMDNHTLSNEGAFDVGVQDFRTMDYSETRVKLGRTSFGTSAAAQKIKNLVQSYVCRAALRLR